MCHFKILKVTQTFVIHFLYICHLEEQRKFIFNIEQALYNSLNRCVCFKLLFPFQDIGHI